MTTKPKAHERIELTPDGVFSRSKGKKVRRLADMIRVSAFATILDAAPEDDVALTEIEFTHRDGTARTHMMPSALLAVGGERVVGDMARLGYHWPAKSYHHKIIAALAKTRSGKTKRIVFVPGWHDGKYLLGKEWVAREEDSSAAELIRTNGVKFPDIARTGSFKRWKKKVAKLAVYSSRIRLMMAAAFVAPLLRQLKLPSFGLLVVANSTIGKTFALRLAASVYGFHDRGEVGSFDATAVDIEQRMFGHRDGFMPLDEVGHLPADDAASFLKQLAFRTSANKSKGRAKSYEISTQSPDADWRLVYGMTSETLLRDLASGGKGGKRLMGEQVRLVELNAIAEGAMDIFDSPRADEIFGKTLTERGKTVDDARKIADENQGHAIVVFLRKLVNDPLANDKLRASMRLYLDETKELCTTRPQLRIAQLFAAIYAAACLAIDYLVLPWKKDPTLRDIKKCMLDAFSLMQDHAKPQAPLSHAIGPNDDELLSGFASQIEDLEIVDLDKKREKLSKRRVDRADGFHKSLPSGERRLLLKASALKTMTPDHRERSGLVRLLQSRNIMDPGRAADTATRQLEIAGETIAHYRLDEKRLRRRRSS